MKRYPALLPALMVILPAALAAVELAAGAPAWGQDATERGRKIIETNCSRCHATGRSGDSPRREALPFRDISRKYPLRHLEEALAEGIVTGHNDMPAFQFEPAEIDAILAYIGSISSKPGAR